MFLIIISLITGYMGMLLGSTYNLEGVLGMVDFLSNFMFSKDYLYNWESIKR